MAKRKKKNAITLGILVLLLAALLGTYFWYDNDKKSKEKTEAQEKQTIDLAKVDAAQVESLHYVKGATDLTFLLTGEVWVEQNDQQRPMNQEHITAMLNAIKDLKADRLIMKSPENLSDYGLEQPQAILTATKKDKSTVTVKLGNKTTDSSGYYGMVNEDNTVYLLPTQMGSALQYDDQQMTALPEAPSITAENITHIAIDNRTGEDFELLNSEEEKLDNTGSNMSSWQFLKPYGEGYTADSSKISELQAKYTTFTYLNCVDYKGEDLKKYGLDDPAATVSVGYYVSSTQALPTPETDPDTGKEVTEKTIKEPYEYKLSIGNQDNEGNYYVKTQDSASVYTMASDSIDAMLKINAFDLVNTYILLPSIDHVDHITAQVGKTVYQMDIDHKTTADKDGKTENTATYTFNGKTADEGAFKSLYQQLIGITYDAETPGDVTAADTAPYLTLTYHIFGDNERTISAAFLPYDDNFYIVKKNGETRFFADKRAVEDIAKALSSFTGKAKE